MEAQNELYPIHGSEIVPQGLFRDSAGMCLGCDRPLNVWPFIAQNEELKPTGLTRAGAHMLFVHGGSDDHMLQSFIDYH